MTKFGLIINLFTGKRRTNEQSILKIEGDYGSDRNG